jgi:hypothetical protein
MSRSKNINGLKWRTYTKAPIDFKSISGAVVNLPLEVGSCFQLIGALASICMRRRAHTRNL